MTIINHNTTMTCIKNIMSILDTIGLKWLETNKKINEVSKSTVYTDDAKTELKQNASTECYNVGHANKQRIVDEFEKLKQAEIQNDELFDLDDANLKTALDFYQRFEKVEYIPTRVNNDIISKFKGQQKALRVLKALFDSKSIDTNTINKYIIDDTAKYIDEKMINVVKFETVSNYGITIYHIVKAIKNYLDIIGEPYTDDMFKMSLDLERVMNNQVRASMGLDPETIQ